MRTLLRFLATYRRPLFTVGCMLLAAAFLFVVTGCGVPTFLTDIETIIPIAGTALSGILAIIGSLTGDAAVTAAGAAVQLIVTKVDQELTQVNDLITQYKANPSDTLLENIETAVQEVAADLGNILTIAGLPSVAATTIQSVVEAVVNQLNALLSVLPVFKSSTAGTSLTVIKPVSAATFKAQIHAALAQPKAA